MAKQKFYTVWKGRNTGVFSDWDTCKEQISGFEGAQYKSFESLEAANQAFKENYWANTSKSKTSKSKSANTTTNFEKKSIAVDAACSGNPGDMEYRGVYVKTGEEIFHQGVYKEATNNIGEFLAIVHGLALLKKKNSSLPLYSDSVTALAWLKAKKCKTKLERTSINNSLFERIEAAEKWLQENSYTTKVMKWKTEVWGEIPADFGRK
ncbi:MAG: ribonuclease H [Bacteroidia bacterium]|nr:ribonuclease H [Bacteroidia bacterium]